MWQRRVLACVDTEERRDKVAAARQLIYQQHYVIDTPQVEALLKPESLLPTKVLIFSLTLMAFGLNSHRGV